MLLLLALDKLADVLAPLVLELELAVEVLEGPLDRLIFV